MHVLIMSKVIKLSDTQKRKRILEIRNILIDIRKNSSVRKEIKRILLN